MVKPKAQVVTNINYQHQEWIRPKLFKKSANKKGIFKQGDKDIHRKTKKKTSK